MSELSDCMHHHQFANTYALKRTLHAEIHELHGCKSAVFASENAIVAVDVSVAFEPDA